MLIALSTSCEMSRSGIASLYLLPCQSVSGVILDCEQQVTGFDVVCNSGVSWVEFTFEKDTAFFSQNLQRSGVNTPVEQVITFTIPTLTKAVRKALNSLKRYRCLLAVVRDNIGQYMLAGVSVYDDGVEYRNLRLSSVAATTGADPAADVNQAVFTLSSVTNTLAPFLTGHPVNISTDCVGRIVFGPVLDGDTAFGPIEDGETAFGP